MTSAQGWAVVTAVLAGSIEGAGHAVGALLAVAFLLVDDVRRRGSEEPGVRE